MRFLKSRYSRRSASILAAVAVLSATAVGCGSDSSDQNAKDDYVIGLAAGITGAAAAIVKGEITGIQAYFHQVNKSGGVNGHKLKLVTEDTKNEATTAVAALTKLATSDHIVGAFGDILANNCQAQIPVAQRYKVPVMCGTLDPAQLQPAEDFAYTQYGSEVTQVDAMMKVLSDHLDLSAAKVALVYVKSSSTVPFFKQVAQAVEKSGGQVVLDDQLGPKLDLAVDANKVKTSGADVVIEQIIPQQLESLAKSLRNIGSEVPIVAEATTASYPQMTLLKNPNIYELSLNRFVDPSDTEPAVKDYVSALGATADLSSRSEINGQSIAISYAAAAFLAEALKTCGDDCDGAKLNDAMQKTSLDLAGINTNYSYTADRHYPQTKFFLYKWSDSKKDVVELADDLPANPIPGS